MTFYMEPDYGGNAFRFRTKEPDLTAYWPLWGEVKWLCGNGYWQGFGGTGYTDGSTFAYNSGGMTCTNTSVNSTMSMRFLGPLETTTPSVSIYSGSSYDPAGGTERIFTNLAANSFGFVPTYMALTGRSNWTGFINEDFSGNSTCFSTSELVAGISLEGIEIRSLVQGCNAIYESKPVYMRKRIC
ncbi:uncharacterized protein LOC110850121 [Folsomia candida]|uniref:uncharacterized protein LOC110850121 n=1 Tax=Folsomia candida TaxID=158441 RepID=UPI0016054F7A|nr:uncharacterized protein LOC110850121 [Folsomia candida]